MRCRTTAAVHVASNRSWCNHARRLAVDHLPERNAGSIPAQGQLFAARTRRSNLICAARQEASSSPAASSNAEVTRMPRLRSSTDDSRGNHIAGAVVVPTKASSLTAARDSDMADFLSRAVFLICINRRR
jgi:hypothetical protein